MQWVEGGVTAPGGFLASGVAAGIKKTKKDLALLFSTVLAAAAGVFTTNRVKAAPLLVTAARLEKGVAQAVVVNSGNANACNGPEGYADALAMGRAAAQALNLPEELVLVSSTGVIGQRLPLEKIEAALPAAAAALDAGGHLAAAEAILTTDTVVKEAAVRFSLGGSTCTIGGMAKGSGMIHPNMATMLAFLTTDVAIKPELLRRALKEAVDASFNMITVDGDTSTNDMVVVLANGRAQNPEINADGPDYAAFVQALTAVAAELAKKVARDGEGATCLIEVRVKGARSDADARLAARAIAASNLVKAAVFGRDANWGRILCAAGYSGAVFDPGKVDIFLGAEQVAADGAGLAFYEERASAELERDPVVITVNFKEGEGAAVAWGCDLTYDYVRINASYRT
ncbi:MAG: bifunctional glutamate N-acetyltransferase/amino-acid acetyltransferase ArgJ [Bacillota bacterium]|jgi:glutamate N-acetyltransferase/amino-acid N-acetyltransferase|nr:bifunctional glutamate N-acetyltransferase/amino-acid acetyltransferase ArgJ [Thermoanaerobacteraceae bacterium]